MDFLNAIVALSNFVLIPAIAYGSQLALGALGVTLIYGILRFSNFAHGDTMAFGSMIAVLVTWWLQSMGVGLGPLPTALLALPLAILGCMALVLITDKLVYQFYREQKAKPVILVIVSMGVMFIMNGLVRFIIGPNDQRFADGERFIISAREFKTADRPARRSGDQDDPRFDRHRRGDRRGSAVLVPEQDPHRQIHARLFPITRIWRCCRASTRNAWCCTPG